MNARSQVIELVVEGRQIEDVIQTLFHTILLHRTYGKFKYNPDNMFSMGSVAVQDTECDFVDFIYVKLKSTEMDAYLRREIASFRDMLRSNEGQNSGQITLEFYRKNKARWPFSGECSPWEMWTIKLDVVNLQSENERVEFKNKLSEELTEKVFGIIDIVNRHEYTPKVPNRAEEELIFDTSFMDIEPYLFKIMGVRSCRGDARSRFNCEQRLIYQFGTLAPDGINIYHQATGPSPTSVGTTMRKFLRGSLAL